MKKWCLLLGQVLLLYGFNWLGKGIASYLPVPVPGSLIGLLLLFICLHKGWVRLQWVEAGATLLFSQMILFFVPSLVGMMQYPWLLGGKGLLVLLVVTSGCALVMVSTGVVAERLFRRGEVKQLDPVENV
ncbi:CidA/LrgA family protein [Brevibacillus gelatini]|uniref:CidA/LrgA family protein n=1 Tax=Brevibacillus gelatini TaxID=1655277 RepID=A0A3M8BA10_9BACL|nr:CidA/LrgA family protein [Brevibacillus gelatini]RNB60266.1 CidA/LrgA family protein [Brevibacillus gelatini]